MPTHSTDQPRWAVIIPVKQTTLAKTRLRGLSAGLRRDLAVAFALDTITAALCCSRVVRVVVVTNDPYSTVFSEAGAEVVPDKPDAGQNPALVYAVNQVRRADPATSVAALSSDLPALRPSDLTSAFEAGHQLPTWFVADAAGTGTTMLAADARAAWSPRFGPNSRAAHRALGATEVDPDRIDGLRQDVDTEDDLSDAMRLGLGIHSARVLASVAHTS